MTKNWLKSGKRSDTYLYTATELKEPRETRKKTGAFTHFLAFIGCRKIFLLQPMEATNLPENSCLFS
jgi:hypothetical protein